MATQPFDLAGVRYVKRIVLGATDPAAQYSAADMEQGMAMLNRCLSDLPKGRIIGMEKNFTVVNMGEHQIVLQWLVYHVGFARKPAWIE